MPQVLSTQPRPRFMTSNFTLKLDQRQLPVSLEDLATMLEIDLMMLKDRKAFAKRVTKAVQAAYGQGQGPVTSNAG